MIDLTKIDLPLHELDDETAAALFLAWRAGKPVEILATNGNWAFWASGHLCLGATYRLRPGTCDWRDSLVQRPKTEGDAIEALQAQLVEARDHVARARYILDTGARNIGETTDYAGHTIGIVLGLLDVAIRAMKGARE